MKAVRTMVVLIVIAAVATGCVENDKSLIVRFAAAWQEDCTLAVQNGVEASFFSSGFLDINHPAFQSGTAYYPVFYLYPQIENNMPGNADPDNLQIESFGIRLERSSVRYEWLGGRDAIARDFGSLLALEETEDTQYVAAYIGPAAESAPGTAVLSIRVIPPAVGSMLTVLGDAVNDVTSEQKVLGVRLKLYGHTVGGTEVESPDFLFPIYLCYGCLSQVCCTGAGEQPYYPACSPGQYTNDLLPCDCGTG